MKLLNRGLALAVVGAGLAALPTIGVQAAPAAQADPNGVAAMADRASGDGRRHAARRRPEGRLHPRQGRRRPAPVRRGQLPRRGDGQGRRLPRPVRRQLRRAPDELVRSDGRGRQRLGWTATYTQSYKGVDVFGSMLRAQVDHEGDLTSVNGFAAPDLSLSVDPRISAADAGKRAVGLVREDPPARRRRDRRPDRHRAARTPSWSSTAWARPGRGRRGRPRLPGRGHQRRQRPRRRLPRRADRQGAQPLLDGARRPRPRALRGHRHPHSRRPHPRVEGGRPVPGHPQRTTSRTWSTPPASPTGSSRTPSAATPTTARAPR